MPEITIVGGGLRRLRLRAAGRLTRATISRLQAIRKLPSEPSPLALRTADRPAHAARVPQFQCWRRTS
jgi:hypothetical protein